MNLNKLNLLGMAAVIALSACSNDKSTRKAQGLASQMVSAADIEAQSPSKKESAEKLALAAEKMALNPGGFIYASELIDKALNLDPQNTRALFYKGLISPFMAQRGIWARMAPWMAKQSAKQQKEFQETIRQMPESGIKEFLLDGKPDIETAADWQNHYSVTRSALIKSRNMIQGLKKETLDANFTIFSAGNKGTDSDIIRHCSPKKLADGVYEIPACNYQYTTPLKMARPDFEAISLSLTTFAVGYTWMFTAYNFEGLERVSKALEEASNNNGYVNYETGLAIVKSEPNFLKLRDPQALKDILSIGNEGMEALRYVLKHQPELCRKGYQDPKNRPGYLFGQGFCSNAEASHQVVTINALLNGPVQIVKEIDPHGGHESDERYLTEINIEQVLKNPIQDLHDILPISMDPTTSQVRFADDTLGGLFPNNDASAFFSFGAHSNAVSVHPAKDLK